MGGRIGLVRGVVGLYESKQTACLGKEEPVLGVRSVLLVGIYSAVVFSSGMGLRVLVLRSFASNISPSCKYMIALT